eukprot:GILI01022350.1.p1 GENE.GILI01022350.1~~GILI01022350.1.p1  ORF type:complete len:186 (+),score=32.74 GILI01022350.1:54-560(+)
MSSSSSSKRKWEFQLNRTTGPSVPEPFGSKPSLADSEESRPTKQSQTQTKELKIKKCWETATAPAKNIFMNVFMLWMAGSSVHIFSIMIVFMTMMTPLKAVLSVNSAFSKFEGIGRETLFTNKLVFIALNFVNLAAGLWKLSTLGLLPVNSGDWVSIITTKKILEMSA